MSTRLFSMWFGCLFVAAMSSLQAKDPPAPPEVAVCKPVVREVSDYEDFTGRTEAAQRVDIRPRVTGFITKVAFKEGSTVKQGDLLFELDPRVQQAELDKAKTETQVAEARLTRSKANLERMQQLLKTGTVAREDYDKSVAELDEAKALLLASKAVLEHAQFNLTLTKISAPISGGIGRANIDAGNLVKADDAILATIVSTDPLYASFHMDEGTLLRLHRLKRDGKLKTKWSELPVRIGLADDTGFPRKARFDLVNNEVDPKTGSLRCRAVLPNAKQEMLPGMFVRVRLTTSDPYKALLVPESALRRRDSSWSVLVLNVKDAIEIRSVKVGAIHDGLRTVNEGLREDDRIVVSAGRLDMLGAPVKPKLVDPTETAPKEKPPLEKNPANRE